MLKGKEKQSNDVQHCAALIKAPVCLRCGRRARCKELVKCAFCKGSSVSIPAVHGYERTSPALPWNHQAKGLYGHMCGKFVCYYKHVNCLHCCVTVACYFPRTLGRDSKACSTPSHRLQNSVHGESQALPRTT